MIQAFCNKKTLHVLVDSCPVCPASHASLQALGAVALRLLLWARVCMREKVRVRLCVKGNRRTEGGRGRGELFGPCFPLRGSSNTVLQ